MKRVAITGIGVISPVGSGKDAFWESIRAGRHGFKAINSFDTEKIGVKYAGEIQDWDPIANGIPKKEARKMDRFCQFASVAADMAIKDAGNFAEGLDAYRIGVLLGSGIGGMQTIHAEHTKYMEKGPDRVSVFFIPMMISNMAGAAVAIKHKFKGSNYCAVSACASSGHAIGEAYRAIRHGYLDAAVTGGAEATISEFGMCGFVNMGALAKGDDPDRVSIPFDKERNGFVMGEGGAVLILEEMEHAKSRGAHIYAELVGYGATDDAYHITSPDPDGEGVGKAMEFAVREAGIQLEEVGYINAHGTATEPNDICETIAIKNLFGKHAYQLAVSSTKSMTGHMLGAAGAIESIACIKALEEGELPPTAGYKVPDPECDLDYVTEGKARKRDIRYAISNTMGFGGHNAALLFKKHEG